MSKCYHHVDPDGHSSAWIVKKAHPDKEIDFVPCNANLKLFLDRIIQDESIIIVDLSFSLEEFKALLEITKDVTWIDHHMVIDEPEFQALNLKGKREIGKAACELTWEYYFPTESKPRYITLIGDFDVHKPEDYVYGNETHYFLNALSLYDLSPDNQFWRDISGGVRHYFVKLIEQGKIVKQYKESTCDRYLKNNAYETTFEGYKTLVVNVYGYASDMFASLTREEKDRYDIFLLYVDKGYGYKVSLRSERINVREIAKKYGGDGHMFAAGFFTDKILWDRPSEKNFMLEKKWHSE